MKSLYLILVMAVCLLVGCICGLNLYAYLDLGLAFGIGGFLYALVFLLSAGLFFRSLRAFLKNVTANQ